MQKMHLSDLLSKRHPPGFSCLSLPLAAGLLASLQIAKAAAAMPLEFTATYEISSPAGDKIGSYITSVKGPESPADSTYKLAGRFELTFKTLMILNYKYLSVDSVSYDRNGIKRYEIVEVDKGKRTVVTGTRSADIARLYLVEKTDREGAEAVSTIILNSSYDYSLFALRFPSPCANHAIGNIRDLRILTPRTGQVDTVRSESVVVDDPHTTEYGAASCRLVTRDHSNKIVKQSYFLENGILTFEKTSDYHMKLTGLKHGSIH